jgi:mycothiol system anti-sigma-R factor
MECEEVLIRLWEYLDDELGPGEAGAVQAHLKNCLGCYPKCCRDRALLVLLARQRTNCHAPAALRTSLLAQLRAS